MYKIAAVVVTFNRKSLLEVCIDKLLDSEPHVPDIVVIDNGSTDGTKDFVLKKYKESIQYYNTHENLGGAGGFAFGLEKAIKLQYDAIWLMDDDTLVEKKSLHELLKADERLHSQYGFLSSIAYWKDGSLCKMNRQKVTLRKTLTTFKDEEIPVIMATFVSFFLKRETVIKFGLPIKDFFIWADDLEYSRRISFEEECYAIPASKVTHYMDSNNKVGIEVDSEDRLWRYEYLYRNEVFVYRREGIKGYIYLFFRVFIHSGRVLKSHATNKKRRLRTIWRSFAKGWKFKPVIRKLSN